MARQAWFIVDVSSGPPLAFLTRAAAEAFLLTHDFPDGQVFTVWTAEGNDVPVAKVKVQLKLEQVPI